MKVLLKDSGQVDDSLFVFAVQYPVTRIGCSSLVLFKMFLATKLQLAENTRVC